MLFNFQSFIEELREKEDKKVIVEKYEKFYGSIKGDITKQRWYEKYLKYFSYQAYKVPEELENEFDWDLLFKLVLGSFSSESRLIKNDNSLPELQIDVKSGDQTVTKTVTELWSFQIMRLYEIYVEEQMNLHILIAEDEKEKKGILFQRSQRLTKWKIYYNRYRLLENLELTEE